MHQLANGEAKKDHLNLSDDLVAVQIHALFLQYVSGREKKISEQRLAANATVMSLFVVRNPRKNNPVQGEWCAASK